MESSQRRTTTRSSQYVPVASQTSWTFGTFGNSRVGVKGAGPPGSDTAGSGRHAAAPARPGRETMPARTGQPPRAPYRSGRRLIPVGRRSSAKRRTEALPKQLRDNAGGGKSPEQHLE